MNYKVKTTKQFDKDANLCVRRGYDTTKLREAISLLSETGTLPQRFKPHKLTGEYKGAWECHIGPDWLMIYNKEITIKLIRLIRTGTHADLFRK